MAILPQSSTSPDGLTVYELVKQGRHPHRKIMNQWSKDDEEAVQRALHDTNMGELMHQSVDSLLGGQRQRAWIALTLAKDTDIILLDEPTTSLPSKTKKCLPRANRKTPSQVNWLVRYSGCAATLPVIQSSAHQCAFRTGKEIVCLRKLRIIRYPPFLKRCSKRDI